MRILIIMPWIKQGGAELIAVETAYQLQQLGHQVRLAATFVNLQSMTARAKAINYTTGGKLGKGLKHHKVLLYFFSPWLLGWLVAKNLFWAEILFPQSLPAYWLAVLIGKPFGKKIVWLCNEPPRIKRRGEVSLADWLMWRLADSPLDRWLVKFIDRIIVYSWGVQKEVQDRYDRSSVLIRLGIDYPFFSQRQAQAVQKLRTKHNLAGKFVLLMVGKLHPQKNQQLGLVIMTKILPVIRLAKLVIVGDGPDYAKLLKKIQIMGLKKEVILTGFASPEQVRTWYQLADLVIYPAVGQTATMSQSWGLVPFEALCQAKLTIVTKDSGAAEILKKEKIGFVAPAAVEEFAAITIEFWQNKRHYLPWAKRGRNWVKNNLTWQQFGQGVNKVLSDVASQD